MSANKSSCGIDSIPMTILKKAAPYLAEPLSHVFSTSLRSGTFPKLFKISLTVPIHKKGPVSEVGNYRPVSLLCSISKILEKIVASRLVAYLEHHGLLTDLQFGFRGGRSTSDAVSSFFMQLNALLSNGCHSVGVFCDLSKAFDRVDHNILLSKLPYYGVRNASKEWFRSYLSGRSQRVKLPASTDGVRHDILSSALGVGAGVPQGSVFGTAALPSVCE
jgi:Reverse transcriptase (RNA-dependent DNA polymerase).